MDVLHLVGRVIFGGFFVFNGVNHLMNLDPLKAYTASKGIPAPGVAVVASGLFLLAGGLSVLLGAWPRVGLWLIIAFLVPVALIMHDFWAAPAEQRQLEMVQFTKDLALLGAALVMLTTTHEWAFCLGG